MSGADVEDIVIPVAVVVLTVVLLTLALRSIFRSAGMIKNGLPGTAVIQRIADTGTTIGAPTIGADAPVYVLGLLVSPSDGAGQYVAESKQAVPRLFVPLIVPGVQVPVDIDPGRRDRVRVSWKRYGGSGGLRPVFARVPARGIGADGVSTKGFLTGLPHGEGEVVSAVRSGSMPTAVRGGSMPTAVRGGSMPKAWGSAAQLLATGVRGTAVITTAMPFGKVASELIPSIDPAHAADPLWFFTVVVELPGRERFPAAFGHRVPRDRVADVAPGLRVAVAVSRDDPSRDVAIDW